ncbi:S9 family peptidase [Neobacillus sp. SAB-20_R2A]|uniref:S9 family peptidase n=1 Tax=Neobacillus sp. SAB-20_R2A TaxID=3120519 RepID=UPI003C6DEA48
MSFQDKELISFLTVNSAYQSKVIPGSERFTFISKITGLPQVWTLDSTQVPVRYIETEDRVIDVCHSPAGGKVVVGVDFKGNEKQQLYLYKADEGILEKLVYSTDHFHYIGGFSPNGEYLSYSSNRRHPGYFDVFVIHIETNEVDTIFTNDGYCTPLNWIDHENLLVSIQETNIDNAIYCINVKTKAKYRIGKAHSLARYKSIAVTKEKDKAYILTDINEDTLHLCQFSFSNPGKMEKVLQIPKCDMEEAVLSPTNQTLAFTINQGGVSKLGLYFPNSNMHVVLDDIPKGVINSLSWLNSLEFVFSLKTPTSPGDIWKYNVDSKILTRLTFVGDGNGIGQKCKDAELCSFKSFDGIEIPYFFYNQGDDVNKPAVIYVHGGPESQTRAEYHPVIQYLVSQGFAVAAPNVRGSNGYGRAYLKLDDADKRMDSVQDLAWLVKALIKSHGVDPKKIGVMGRSYGGFMVLAAVTHYPDLWAAGVNIVGISNFKTFLKNTGEWRRYLRECEYGSLEVYSEFFEEIAPLNHSDKIKAPLLVVHGRNDTRVPVSEAEQLVRDMVNRNQTVDLIVFEDEGHQTEKIENHIILHTRTVEFFKQYLN